MADTSRGVGDAVAQLDRLAGLTQLISPTLVQEVLQATGRSNPRACRLSHEVTTWLLLALGLLTDVPIRRVYQQARRWQPTDPIPTRSALCQARQRLGVAPLRALFTRVVRPLTDAQTPGATLGGLRLLGIDSTTLDVPDTPANAAVFGRPSGGRGDGAFPQVRKLSLVELGSRAELAFVVKPCERHEVVPAWGLRRHLGPGMLLLADRAFFSFALWEALVTQGCHLLWRGRDGYVLEPQQLLADGSYLSQIYACPQDRRRDRQPRTLRVIKYTLTDPQRVGHQEVHVLLTSLLDAAAFPAVDLILAYHHRWEQEILYDEQKTHHDPVRPGKAAQLRSGTPAGVVQELYALSLGHYVTQAVRCAAARQEQIDPDRLSFMETLRVLRCRLPECVSRQNAALSRWFGDVLAEVAAYRLERRRPRINPRVVKQQVSNYAKKHPHHRGLPSQRKPFLDSVVMLI